MQKILQIAQRDIRLEFSSPSAWLFFLILPLMFTGIFAGQFSSGDEDNPNPGVQLLIVDQDQSGLSADLVSKLDDEYGKLIRDRAHDSVSLGVAHQAKARELADKFGYVEPHLWTGIGRARSGCGAALVGSTDQILSELESYKKMGIRAFILSGYPHIDECKHFGTKVLPQMKTCSLPEIYGRVPETQPLTPLAAGPRS